MVAGMEEIQRRWSRGRMFSHLGTHDEKVDSKTSSIYLQICPVFLSRRDRTFLDSSLLPW